MPSTYKTPGVYVEEISVFPPSIAQVETAVPAFIGYTYSHSNLGEDLLLKPVKIRSLAEYEEMFGKGPAATVDSIQLDAANNVTATKLADGFLLYDSLRLFYANGGSKCYIISIGTYPESGTVDVDLANFEAGLAKLEKEDEPTLILFPDAIFLPAEKIIALQQAALAQAAKLGDRFCILDVRPDEKNATGQVTAGFLVKVDEFRNAIGVKNLKYGAAYGPYLKTNLEKGIRYRDIKGKVQKTGAPVSLSGLTTDPATVESIGFLDKAVSDREAFAAAFPGGTGALETAWLAADADFKAKLNDPNASLATQRTAYKNLLVNAFDILSEQVNPVATNAGAKFAQGITNSAGKPVRFLIDEVAVAIGDAKPGAFHNSANTLLALATHSSRVGVAGAITAEIKPAELTGNWGLFDTGNAGDYYAIDDGPLADGAKDAAQRANLRQGAATATSAFKAILAEISSLADTAKAHEDTYENALVATFPLLKTIIDRAKNTVTEMPPSGALAGVYTDVDATRGVHKAPANVSLSSVIGLTEVISHEEQEDLNVDVIAGKSINVIRPFTGKGILVWGARTLAGNDNEWRYISVRRFFNMVEESTKKATDQFVFEPNDANTWTKVKAMIENFLINQWRSGALAGSTPEKAFFVRVGLGQTMTAQDVLEGKMIVEIGMAAVRPAEFIILRFSHKMQEA